jgi:SAM-dependent methyltransferase
MPHSTRHFGIDVFPGREVDALIEPNRPWPVEDGEFDVVLCTQVLEHVVDLELTLREITRTLKPGGHLIVTTPFIFGEHNSPDDYRRLSQHELRRVVDERFEIVELRTLGGIGSTLGALFLGWTYDALPTGRVERWAIAPLLPLWLALCLLVNALGLILSTADRTGLYYGNLLVHARHRGAD